MQKAKNRLLKSVVAAAFATTLFTGTLVSAPAYADEIKDWKKAIAMKVAKKQVYPRSAINRQLEGDARVEVVIDRSGAMTGYTVVQATGHSILDKEVEKLMKRIDPLPAPPDVVSDDQLSFVLPLSWVLQ